MLFESSGIRGRHRREVGSSIIGGKMEANAHDGSVVERISSDLIYVDERRAGVRSVSRLADCEGQDPKVVFRYPSREGANSEFGIETFDCTEWKTVSMVEPSLRAISIPRRR